MRLTAILLLFFIFTGFSSCEKDTPVTPPIDQGDGDSDSGNNGGDDPDPDTGGGDNPPSEETSVEFINRDLVDNNLLLVNDAAANKAYIMDKEANVLFDWPLNGERLGNDVFLMDDGSVLANLEAPDPKIQIGGFGGKLQIIDKEGNISWNFDYSSDDFIAHHDAAMLPNGNVLIMIWEKKTASQAIETGYKMNVDLFPDGIIEVNRTSNEIVWEWHLWDHIIQDNDMTKPNFGDVSANPQRIDINYNQRADGDITHGNALTYDAENDLIYLSVNFYHEVWVIDHSTTNEEAAGTTGGNFGKGGDLVYRFGNPTAYESSFGQRLFYNNHFPNLIDSQEGKLLIFSNGNSLDQSTAYELKLPLPFDLKKDADNEPEVVWSFTDPDLYSPKVSGVVLLPNGNRLITEGDFGIWEVTEAGEVVWKFKSPGFFWRTYSYEKDHPAIKAIGL
ncbi:aryl-sulfate sulfotransferase [Spongiivirga citrea]|uniref:Arylsulfotransferase (ASST) n=1 Tax=Spongiivirga citrea TaxID=1481457 RepID=A0A6M0CFJ5_9FLAO|nr:aryl-sulfate sulfotransferase [Spongiivirga citrea]NER16212.1 hypothetical protein [Spongiivirga citrea]